MPKQKTITNQQAIRIALRVWDDFRTTLKPFGVLPDQYELVRTYKEKGKPKGVLSLADDIKRMIEKEDL